MSSPRRRSSRGPTRSLSGAQLWPLAIAVVVAAIVVGGGLLLFQRGGSGPAPAASSTSVPSSPELSAGEGLGDLTAVADPGKAAGGKTLQEAIASTLPRMADTTDRLDEGSAQLALWAAQHLRWSELAALPETSPALFRKDPTEERGKRLCGAGRIDVVRAERNLARRLESDRPLPLPAPATVSSVGVGAGDAPLDGVPASFWDVPDGKVFFAVIDTSEQDPAGAAARRPDRDEPAPLVLSAIAVRSTGKLVDGDRARVCGVLTGVNVIRGGTNDVLAHRIVGMFDLPENRSAP
jgi:hypothetical protein